MTDPTPQTTPTRDEAVRSFWETQRDISHHEADEAASRLINSHFKNDAERARVSIPANPDRDDDLIIRSYIRQQMRLAPAPAPASGGVDVVAVKRKLLLEWAEDFDEASKKFERLEKCVLRTRAQECRDLAASLSPAATPVSEAGGEPDWNGIARRMQRAGAPGTEEELEAALRAALGKPASSPAGGGVVEALKAIAEGYAVSVCDDRYIIVDNPAYRPDDGSSPKLVLDTASLSQSTSAGRVGE